MKKKLLFLFLVIANLNSCRSWSLLKESDCDIAPEVYGQCYADRGLNPQAYEVLTNYCKGGGKYMDWGKFENARQKRLAVLCATPYDVFNREIHTFGPVTCPENLLTTPALKQAQEDGRKAKFYADEAKADDKKMRTVPEKHDKVFLKDKNVTVKFDPLAPLLHTSAEDYERFRNQKTQKSEHIRAQYVKPANYSSPELMSNCNPHGHH